MSGAIFNKPVTRKMKKEGLFGIDLHFHTRYSLDSIARIPEAIKKAKKKGFGFAITDHNTIKGIQVAQRINKKDEPVQIIPGIEVTCKNGNHVLLYFYEYSELKEFFKKELSKLKKTNPFFIDISTKELLAKSQEHNCISCAPHPFAPGAVGIMNTKPSENLTNNIPLAEVINGYNFRQANLKALYWATKQGKSLTGGSDAHSVFDLGKVLTFTQGKTTEELFSEIKNKKSIVIGKEDNLLLKTVTGIRKESQYVKRTSQNNMAKKLLASQFGTEYTYLKEKFRDGKAYQMLKRNHEMFFKKYKE